MLVQPKPIGTGGSTTFTGLMDTLASYTGQSLKALRVNSGETAVESYTPAIGSDFTVIPNLSGSRTTTTLASQLTSGTNTCDLMDASTFAVGQGISIVGGGTAGPNSNEHITTITDVTGASVTLADNATATATIGNTVYHDDTSAIKTALQAGGKWYLPEPSAGYNVTSRIDFAYDDTTLCGPDFVSLAPDGSFGSFGYGSTTPRCIYSRIKTDYLLKVPAGIDHTSMAGITIKQDPLVTPTAGGGILIGEVNTTTGDIPQPTTLFNVGVHGTWNGIHMARQFQTFGDWITTRGCLNIGVYSGETTSSSGGIVMNNIFAEDCALAGLYIDKADHDTFNDVRTWRSGNSSGGAIVIESTGFITALKINGATLDEIQNNSAAIKTIKGAAVIYAVAISDISVHMPATTTGAAVANIGANTTVILDSVDAYGLKPKFIINGTNCQITNCKSHITNGTPDIAFTIGANANHITMSDCIASGGPTYGLSITAGAQNLNIQGNDFSSATTGPILYGTGTRSYNIRNNTGANDWITSVASTPNFVGQEALSGGQFYKAVGTSSSADWKQTTV